MFKSFCLVTIVITGVALRTVQADDATKEKQCIEEIEDELEEYVKLEAWQEIFRHHYKFVISNRGKVKNARKRTKSNTMIHDALYGKCDPWRDDEVDDCPYVHRGVIKSCQRGLNLRAAVFRTARCAFVESSIKHLVLGDALLDTFPPEELDNVSDLLDKPIREFGESVANMLSVLAHGEIGGMAELMAVNLYLNNKHGAVFTHKIPAEPVATMDRFVIAEMRMREVHGKILEGLYAFWDTWCGDRDVVQQYRMKYAQVDEYRVLLEHVRRNGDDTADLIRGLNVAGTAVDLDFDPKALALDDFVDRLTAGRGAMPAELSDHIRFRSFELSYAFDPRALYEHHEHVFRTIYACVYWSAVAHLRLAARYLDTVENFAAPRTRAFAVHFVRFVRPLAVFHLNQVRFVPPLPADAAHNVARLYAFLMDAYRGLREDRSSLTRNDDEASIAMLSWKPGIQEFVDVLTADMETVTGLKPPPPTDGFGNVTAEEAFRYMRTNYRTFARLVSATSECKRDLENLVKLKRFFFYLVEAVPFDLH